MEVSLGFDQVAIKQKKNICNSRGDVNITSEIIRGVHMSIPLIAANMSTVCNPGFCLELRKYGSLGILHRADTKENLIQHTSFLSTQTDLVAVSIGAGEDQKKLARDLVRAGANIVVIDIAHGYCDAVISAAKDIKRFSPDTKVVVGNTVNEQMLYEVNDCADAVKIGCGSGMACETANTAGCTERQFSAVLKMKAISKKLGLPIISDGGIRQPSDFTKAIGAGANSVMAGSILARCPESAAKTIVVDDTPKKQYSGMASRQVQEQWRGSVSNNCPEGKTILLDMGEPVSKLLDRYAGALRSGITYAGGKDIQSFQDTVEFIRI